MDDATYYNVSADPLDPIYNHVENAHTLLKINVHLHTWYTYMYILFPESLRSYRVVLLEYASVNYCTSTIHMYTTM